MAPHLSALQEPQRYKLPSVLVPGQHHVMPMPQDVAALKNFHLQGASHGGQSHARDTRSSKRRQRAAHTRRGQSPHLLVVWVRI